MQKFLQLIIILLFIFTLVGCGYKNSDIDSSFPNELNIGKPDASLDTDRQKGKENEVEGKSNQPLPGQLTASVLFDHSYYNYWNSLFQNPGAIFYNVHSKGYFNPTNRIIINIPNVYNAKVELINENHNKKIGYTNNQGICYLFLDDDEINENNEYQIKVTYKTNNSFKTFDKTIQLLDNTATLSLDKSENENHIQVMFIIDTTSSMIDEFIYKVK